VKELDETVTIGNKKANKGSRDEVLSLSENLRKI